MSPIRDRVVQFNLGYRHGKSAERTNDGLPEFGVLSE